MRAGSSVRRPLSTAVIDGTWQVRRPGWPSAGFRCEQSALHRRGSRSWRMLRASSSRRSRRARLDDVTDRHVGDALPPCSEFASSHFGTPRGGVGRATSEGRPGDTGRTRLWRTPISGAIARTWGGEWWSSLRLAQSVTGQLPPADGNQQPGCHPSVISDGRWTELACHRRERRRGGRHERK
jgi:hypothetical protein